MKKIPAELVVKISIETSDRIILFDSPLQKYLEAESAGRVLLTRPNLQNNESGRFSWGFSTDFVIYHREKAISCIRKALKHISATEVQFRIYNEQTKQLEHVDL